MTVDEEQRVKGMDYRYFPSGFKLEAVIISEERLREC